MFVKWMLVGAAALTATAAIADEAANKPTERQVCKYTTKPNSRFRDRTCHSKAEWEAQAEAARRAGKEMFDVPKIETRRGG